MSDGTSFWRERPLQDNSMELSCRRAYPIQPRHKDDFLHLYATPDPYFTELLSGFNRSIPQEDKDFRFPLIADITSGSSLVRDLSLWCNSKSSTVTDKLLGDGHNINGAVARHASMYLFSYGHKLSYEQVINQVRVLDTINDSYHGNTPQWLRDLLQEREEEFGETIRFLRSRERAYMLVSSHYRVFRVRAMVLWGAEDRAAASRVTTAIERVIDPTESKPLTGYLEAIQSFDAWRNSDPRTLFPSKFTELGELSLGRNRKREWNIDDLRLLHRLRELDELLKPAREALELEALLEELNA